MDARGLKPRKEVCLAEAARIARGPKRAPEVGLLVKQRGGVGGGEYGEVCGN